MIETIKLMFTSVLCMSCGFAIGEYAEVFQRQRAKLVRTILEERKTSPVEASIDTDLQIECGNILDKLNITQYCCRKTLVTTMIFNEYH